MAQLEVFLGLKMGQHFPSIRTPYTEPILPDDVSDSGEEEPSLMASAGPGPSTISAGAAARAERAANAAFLAATKPQQLRLLDEYSESPFSQSAVLPDSSLT